MGHEWMGIGTMASARAGVCVCVYVCATRAAATAQPTNRAMNDEREMWEGNEKLKTTVIKRRWYKRKNMQTFQIIHNI